MRNFYEEIKKDFKKVQEFIDFYNNEYEEASKETIISGNVVEQTKQLPQQMAYRFSQLQEIEAVLHYIEILRDEQVSQQWVKYTEHYKKLLSAGEKKNYVMGEQTVVQFEKLVNEVAFIRNKYIALTKGFDCKNFALSNIIKLKVAGVDDWDV